MKKVLVVLALLLVPGIALAVPTITFDTTPGGAGGTLTYDGLGGPLVGTGIVFVDILGVDTPLNSGDLMDCVGCSLAFTTGNNIQEGPAQWIWAGGGSFTLTGSVPDLGLPAGSVLLSGSFTGTPILPVSPVPTRVHCSLTRGGYEERGARHSLRTAARLHLRQHGDCPGHLRSRRRTGLHRHPEPSRSHQHGGPRAGDSAPAWLRARRGRGVQARRMQSQKLPV